MSAITYTAKRNVDGSRTSGIVYSFDVNLNQYTRQVDRHADTMVSLSGTRITTFHRIDENYNVSTVPINDSTLLTQMREFLDSVAGGETFTLDAFGSVASPDNAITFVLENYTETLVDLSGFYSFSFKVIKQ